MLLYASAHAVAAIDPERAPLLVAIGAARKFAGPIGLTVGVLAGTLPWQFVFVVMTNDLV